jgi:hypothetical protein
MLRQWPSAEHYSSRELNVAPVTVWRSLLSTVVVPMHLYQAQGLKLASVQHDKLCVDSLLNITLSLFSFICLLFFSDDTRFGRNDITNFHQWAERNPHVSNNSTLMLAGYCWWLFCRPPRSAMSTYRWPLLRFLAKLMLYTTGGQRIHVVYAWWRSGIF